MFGISDVPEIYQHIIQQVLAGCKAAENILDDNIAYDMGEAVHDRKLKKVLCHLRGLTLNRAKCEFCLPQVTFMGFIQPQSGPTEAKVEVVSKAREPENASGVGSFLGLVNFLA